MYYCPLKDSETRRRHQERREEHKSKRQVPSLAKAIPAGESSREGGGGGLPYKSNRGDRPKF